MRLKPGIPAPIFEARSHDNPEFFFGGVGGLYVLLGFLPEPGPAREAAMALVSSNLALFDNRDRTFVGFLPDEGSFEAAPRHGPGVRWLADFDGRLRSLYGAVDSEGAAAGCWVLVDPTMRIMSWAPLEDGQDVLTNLAGLGRAEDHAGATIEAPILMAPRILEPELCAQLIGYYEKAGGAPSGVMQDRGGVTVAVMTASKRRSDVLVSEEALLAQLRTRLATRLLPQIEKVFQFRATRVERYVVACYDSLDRGYFRAHRDNISRATAHRRFAVTINLNDDFAGGELRFPEFGRRGYKPPAGTAVVFSCSLLHEVTPVVRGKRFAFLPFLYDEAARRVRDENLKFLAAAKSPEAEG